jgi:TorA maturation chaperone TorD
MPFIPPYESIYLGERRLMGETVGKVVQYYKRFGLYAEGEMPDHIAHECEFMAILYEKDESLLAREFLREHLLKWGWMFFEDLLTLAKLDFYKGIALIGRELFSWEISKNEE